MSLYLKKPWDFSFLNFMSRANLYEPALSQIYMKWESGPVEVYPWFMSTVQLWNDSGITYDLTRCQSLNLKGHVRFSLKFIPEQSCMRQLQAIFTSWKWESGPVEMYPLMWYLRECSYETTVELHTICHRNHLLGQNLGNHQLVSWLVSSWTWPQEH